MRFNLIALLAMLSCLAATTAKDQDLNLESIGNEKLTKMLYKEKHADQGIIELSPREYTDLIQRNPRPYDVVLLWNVPPGRCDHCQVVASEFNTVAYSFHADRGTDKVNGKKIFFVRMIFNQADKESMNIFKEAGLMTVPYLTVSPLDHKRDSENPEIFASENKWLIGQSEVYDANKQIEFINNALRTDVKIKFTFINILFKNFMGFLIIGLLFQFVKVIYPFLMQQYVWFGIAIVVFLVCTGGLVYSMLNNMPLFKFERNEFGQVVVKEYIMRGQRG